MKKVTTAIAALMLLAGGTLYAQTSTDQTMPKQGTTTTPQQTMPDTAVQNNSTTNNAINPTGQRNDGWNKNQAPQRDSSAKDNAMPQNNSTTNNAINPTGQQNGSPFSTNPSTQSNTTMQDSTGNAMKQDMPDRKSKKKRKEKMNDANPN